MVTQNQIRINNGIRVLRVTKVTKSASVSAKSIYCQQINGLLSRHDTPMARAMTTSRLSDHLNNKELSPAYIRSVERAVNTIIKKYDITSPTTENAIKLKSKMKERGLKPNSIRLYLWAMKYWAQSLGRNIDFDECPIPKVEEEPIETIDFKIIRKVLDNPTFPERDRAIICLFAYTACRVRELVELKVEALDLIGGMVTLKGKRNKVRQVPLAPECIIIMKSWMEIRNVKLAEMDRESPYVFVTTQGRQMSTDLVRQMMGRMKKQIGGDIKKFHPHQIRHTSLTKMCNTKDVNLREVQQIAGHSSLTITERYTHVNLDQIKEKFTKNLAY